jgi:hypothetical protein
VTIAAPIKISQSGIFPFGRHSGAAGIPAAREAGTPKEQDSIFS